MRLQGVALVCHGRGAVALVARYMRLQGVALVARYMLSVKSFQSGQNMDCGAVFLQGCARVRFSHTVPRALNGLSEVTVCDLRT